MAKRAGVYSIWAAYGSRHNAGFYDGLVRVSHWTPSEVERELRLRAEAKLIEPDFVADNSFDEILIPLGIRQSQRAAVEII